MQALVALFGPAEAEVLVLELVLVSVLALLWAPTPELQLMALTRMPPSVLWLPLQRELVQDLPTMLQLRNLVPKAVLRLLSSLPLVREIACHEDLAAAVHLSGGNGRKRH